MWNNNFVAQILILLLSTHKFAKKSGRQVVGNIQSWTPAMNLPLCWIADANIERWRRGLKKKAHLTSSVNQVHWFNFFENCCIKVDR